MLQDRFSQIFREEHRRIRDCLLELIRAFQGRDQTSVRSLLEQVAACAGPHFRYEEEALYPALVHIFGEEYIEKLLEDHDRAIEIAVRLLELAHKESLTDDDAATAVELIRRVLPHVSDCDGLSIMTETLPEQEIRDILDARQRANEAGLDLLTWSRGLRERSAAIAE